MLKVYFAENGCSVADPSASAIIGNNEVLRCGQCGHASSDQWHRVDGKFICLDCYKKMQASKENTKESSPIVH